MQTLRVIPRAEQAVGGFGARISRAVRLDELLQRLGAALHNVRLDSVLPAPAPQGTR